MDNQKFTADQALHALFQDAMEHAPEPPLAWFRKQLAQRAPQFEHPLRDIWDGLLVRVQTWRSLLEERPRAWSPASASTGGSIIHHDKPLGIIPACVVAEHGGKREVRFEAQGKPWIAGSFLKLTGRVVGNALKEKERLELILMTTTGEPSESSILLNADETTRLALKIPPTLQQEWQDIKSWDWEHLPFFFILRPHGSIPDNT